MSTESPYDPDLDQAFDGPDEGASSTFVERLEIALVDRDFKIRALEAEIVRLTAQYLAADKEATEWNALYCQELGRTRTLTTAGQALADLAGENCRQQTASNSEAADLEDFEGWLDGFLLREATALATWEQAVTPA